MLDMYDDSGGSAQSWIDTAVNVFDNVYGAVTGRVIRPMPPTTTSGAVAAATAQSNQRLMTLAVVGVIVWLLVRHR